MADVPVTQIADFVKVVGSASDGTEQTPVKSSANGDLQTSDLLVDGGAQTALTVGTTAVEVKAGVSPLANRKLVTVYNNSNNIIYWGYTNAVTTANGTPIDKKQFFSWDASATSTIWLIAGTAGNDVRITEGA